MKILACAFGARTLCLECRYSHVSPEIRGRLCLRDRLFPTECTAKYMRHQISTTVKQPLLLGTCCFSNISDDTYYHTLSLLCSLSAIFGAGCRTTSGANRFCSRPCVSPWRPTSCSAFQPRLLWPSELASSTGLLTVRYFG